MKLSSLKATSLRIILFVTLLAIIGVAGAAFISQRDRLEQYAIEVSHKRTDAKASDSAIQSLEKIESELATNQEVIAKAKSLKADSELPQFRIVDDVTRHAKNNGIVITSFDFGGAAAAGQPAKPAAGATPKKGSASAASGGTVSLTVTLDQSVNYTRLLQFLRDLEQNLPKMQVQGINLKAGAASGKRVAAQPIVIQMYTR